MEYITTVRVLVRETRQPLANVKVELFDRDERSPDDSLGFLVTNAFGEATFKYTTADFADGFLGNDEGFALGSKRDTVPDLYPVIYNKHDQIVLDQREEATHNNAALMLVVLVDEALVREHHLGTA